MTVHIPVPGDADLSLDHLVLDVNGTLTNRGEPIAGVAEALAALRERLDIHLLSADTFGTAGALADRLGAAFRRVADGGDKRRYVEALGATHCVAVGNGRNDAPMLRCAVLGIAVLGPEGANARAAAAADVLVRSIGDALALLLEPRALTATLRP